MELRTLSSTREKDLQWKILDLAMWYTREHLALQQSERGHSSTRRFDQSNFFSHASQFYRAVVRIVSSDEEERT